MKKNILTIAAVLIIASFGNGCKTRLVTEKSDPKESAINALKKLKEVKFYHAITKDRDDKTVGEYFYVSPDKLHKIGGNNDMIVIGKDKYLSPDNFKDKAKIEKSLYGDLYENWQFPDTYYRFALLDKKHNFTLKGQETINGNEALLYQDDFGKVWVSTETGLPLQLFTDNDFGGSFKPITTTFDYDKEPKIEDPTNVK